MSDRCVSATVRIDARPEVVYSLRRWSRVTESAWDRRPGWFHKLGGKATGVTDRVAANRKNIELTLQRLKRRAEGR
jgi:hypothetical protein